MCLDLNSATTVNPQGRSGYDDAMRLRLLPRTVRRLSWSGTRWQGLALCVAAVGLTSAIAWARVDVEARSASEIYERKGTIAACVTYVAEELKARVQNTGGKAQSELLLIVDPAASLSDDIAAMAASLQEVWRVGPPSLRIGVYGVGNDTWSAPTRVPPTVKSALEEARFMNVEGIKNLHAAIRDAVEQLGEPRDDIIRSLLVISDRSAECEDNVEETREALLDAGVSFYCIAPESGFERTWVQAFKARGDSKQGVTERFNPMPKKAEDGALFYGSEVAFGLVPYRWEFRFAQTDFVWVRPPAYPVPSGFGYWSLATLCHATGGRYFIYDFGIPAASKARTDKKKKRKELYNYARLSLLTPDLRARRQVLKSLSKDWRATSIVRIWERLANESVPILQERGTLEARGSTLVPRPARAVRASATPVTWYTDMKDVRAAMKLARERITALENVLKSWRTANAKERPAANRRDGFSERLEADFQLLGVQLRKLRFHWGEVMAALKSIRSLDVSYRRVRLLPKVLLVGVGPPALKIDLEDKERNARFAELCLSMQKMSDQFEGTPWSLVLNKGSTLSFIKDVHVIEDEARNKSSRTRSEKDGSGNGKKKKDKNKKKKKKRPSAPPPPGPRPGSGSGGPTSGG